MPISMAELVFKILRGKIKNKNKKLVNKTKKIKNLGLKF
jgi:hypothetical protein